MDLRSKILTLVYKSFPFSLKGDALIEDGHLYYDVSCVINFYGRTNLLRRVLYSLSEQDLPRERFEVILVEDQGGTQEGRETSEMFKPLLNIRYFPLTENHGEMGYSRNLGLSKARGRVILFLDDDTVILQRDFLSTLIDEFANPKTDAIIPRGSASYCLIKGRYDFHDPYFPTNRCMAYRREALKELGGFVSGITGQEDVEFVVRFIASGRRFHRSGRLNYLHPPLILSSLNKAAAVGMSFARLKNRYPFIVWLMLLINGSRYLPMLLFPINERFRMKCRFSIGFLLGILYSIIGKKIEYN
jgi:glycosyltransferase involved in cell wall biosynthesis